MIPVTPLADTTLARFGVAEETIHRLLGSARIPRTERMKTPRAADGTE